MTEIRDWLSSGRNYIEGVRLYLHYGQDPDFKVLLTEEAETPYKRTRLEKALREVLKGVEVAKTVEEKLPARISEKSWPAEAAKDDVLKALRAEWLTHFKAMQDLRSQLLLLPTVQERGEAAFEILRLDALCDEIYDRRDFYLQHGTLPQLKSTQSEVIVDPAKIMQRMENLKRYIRRETANLEKNPGDADAAARKKKWIQEYNTYAAKFNADLIDGMEKTETADV